VPYSGPFGTPFVHARLALRQHADELSDYGQRVEPGVTAGDRERLRQLVNDIRAIEARLQAFERERHWPPRENLRNEKEEG